MSLKDIFKKHFISKGHTVLNVTRTSKFGGHMIVETTLGIFKVPAYAKLKLK